ncbi:MAG: DUF721 domain-containing protein [Candidatus Latescibacteria bacterium]|nr:DUF721 domain-containing protein [Candidatus Latescibacterota bacterium]
MKRVARRAGGPGTPGARGAAGKTGRGRDPELESVGSILGPVLQGLRLEDRFAAAEASDRWDEVVGPAIRARTRCVGVRDAELLVEVRGAVWMGHLALLRQGILDQINERLAGEKKIRTIRFVPMRTKEESRA